jgi:ankyrin repeat domain-containing protein 50
MAEPLSITSGIAGLISLSATVLTAGYNYLNSVSSAPEDFTSLIRKIASLNAVLSQLISHSLSEQTVHQIGPHALVQQDVLQDCEKTLLNIQLLIRDCKPVGGHRRKNALNALVWPLKQKEIIKNRERLSRLCANLHTTISIESASTLRALEHEQKWGSMVIRELVRNTDDFQEQKLLEWLSPLDPIVKHTAATLLKQPGTDEWFLQEKTFLDWLNDGSLLWLHGISGTGKTVLM